MTAEELGGRPLDVLLVTGDAYVDHPAWGVALIGRWLEHHGYTVGVIAQPDHTDVSAFEVLGRPRLFAGITAGNMDTMVNKYTASRRPRSDDAYSPGGRAGTRPDRASIPYTAKVRQAFPGLPIILGGVEASLRRMAHFDFWSGKIRGSILLDAKADLLVHGMGESAILEIARRLEKGAGVRGCRDIPGIAWATGAKEAPPEGDGVIIAPSTEQCRNDRLAFNRLTLMMYRESNPHCGRVMVQTMGSRAVVVNRPAVPVDTTTLDEVHELPYAFAAHPCYRKTIPALEMMAGSITVNRGCSGGCSFCALTMHQGKDVVSRSTDSVLREVQRLTKDPKFKGVISDLGGPTANMFHMNCTDEAANQVCRRVSCLHPKRCKFYGTDHGPYLDLLRKVRQTPGIRRVYVNSGIRYDLAALDRQFVEELAEHHVPGQLSVAPEHAADGALDAMRKPGIDHFSDFMKRFKRASEKAGKKQFLVPYFQCAHPGTGPEQAIELALYMKAKKLRPRQVQMFMPTPGTLATAMYVSGRDPHTNKSVYVARGRKERSRQRALLFYWKREEAPHVREALIAWGRRDLIGRGPQALVAPGPAFGAWQRKAPRRSSRGGMGMQVERGDGNWESVGRSAP